MLKFVIMQSFILEFEVLTPVHIGGLRDLNRRIHRLEDTINEIERLFSSPEYKIFVDEMKRRLQENIELLKKCYPFSDGYRFIRDGNGNPIVPGSSIKGAFSSGIEHYKGFEFNTIERNKAFRNIMFRDAYLNEKDLIDTEVVIGGRLLLKVEAIRPGVKFETEMIYKENNTLRLDEVFVYPTIKTLHIIKLIIDKGHGRFLPQKEILEYFKKFISLFPDLFRDSQIVRNKTSEIFDFIKENGMLLRLGKFTGMLSKITLQDYEREYNNVSRGPLKYVGRLSRGVNKNMYYMGFVKIKIKND